MIHLKRLGVGFIITVIIFGFGYFLADLTMTIKDFEVIDASLWIAKGLAIVIVAYLVGWTIVDK